MYNVVVVMKFCKGDEQSFALKMSEDKHSGWPFAVNSDQLRALIKTDPLTATWEVTQELSANHSTVIWHLTQIGKV